MKDTDFWVALNHILCYKPKFFGDLVTHFGSAKKVWEEDEKNLEKIDKKLGTKIADDRKRIDPQKLLAKILAKKIKILTLEDKYYPKLLKEIHDPPPVLYFRGELKSEDSRALAVVGSRKMTIYGRQVTEGLISSLSFSHLTIVSGLARGIDSLAHKTAVNAGGRTIAVLGSGIDIIYPPENKKLYEEIINGNGVIFSEFPPGTEPNRANFPQRNRIIAGLSLGVLVIEAAEKSGSMITPSYALDFGREVFAVPGPILSKTSAGTAFLIKEGAKLVTRVEDILEELEIESSIMSHVSSDKSQVSSGEQKILDILDDEPKHIDKIVAELNLETSSVSSLLTLMEIRGIVKNLGAGLYCKSRIFGK